MIQQFYGCRFFCGGEWEPVYAPADTVEEKKIHATTACNYVRELNGTTLARIS